MQKPENKQSKQSECSQIEENLRLFKESVENSSDAVGMSTPEGKHEDINSFRRLFIKNTGISPKDYRNKFSSMYRNLAVQ